MIIIRPGVYKTRCGYKAVVARTKFSSTGAIIIDNVYYLYKWNYWGGSLMGEVQHDIIEKFQKE